MSGFILTYENIKGWCERMLEPRLWKYNDEAQQVAILTNIDDSEVPLVIIPRLDRGMVTLAVTMPFSEAGGLPAARFSAIAEALTLLNSRSYMGAWILNTDKGDVYFRVTVPALDIVYSDQGFLFVVNIVEKSSAAMASRLRAVALDNAPPESVLPKSS